MAAEMSNELRQALEAPNYWHLATLNPDGSPQSTTVWVHTRGDKALVNTALGRKKPRNIDNDPRVAMSVHLPGDAGYESFGVQGRVVEKITGDQAEADIDMLAKKYIGQDVYPWRSPGEQRVTYLVELEHVLHMAA